MKAHQERRARVIAALKAHIEAWGERDWGRVQRQFPGLPPATFWRYVRLARTPEPRRSSF